MIGALALVLTLALAISVSAHAAYKSSVPAANGTVQQAPGQVMIIFSEETDPLKSGGSVTDAGGVTVSTGFKVDLNERTNMAIDLKPNLPSGVYTVKWNTFTDDDSGMADGTFTFTIQLAGATTVSSPVNGTAATGSAVTSVQPVATIAATAAPTATPAATATAATTVPTALPQTEATSTKGGFPWLLVVIVVVVLAGAILAAWSVMRRRAAPGQR